MQTSRRIIMCPSRTRDAARFAIDDQLSQPLEFGYHALLDGHMVTWRLAREFPAHAADLMEIAASAYAVDRLARRPSRRVAQAGATSTRKLRIEIPVREPNLWAAHAEELASLLTWLTDDEWQIEFYQLSVGRGLWMKTRDFCSTLCRQLYPYFVFGRTRFWNWPSKAHAGR